MGRPRRKRLMSVEYHGRTMQFDEAIAKAIRDIICLPLGMPGISCQQLTGVFRDGDPDEVFVICDTTKPRKYRVEAYTLDEAVELWNSHVGEWMQDFK